MKAIQIESNGGPEVIAHVDLPDPEPGPGEVVVDVAAAGVNFIDTYHRSGLYPVELPFRLGVEGAGVVSGIGEGVDDLRRFDAEAFIDALLFAEEDEDDDEP